MRKTTGCIAEMFGLLKLRSTAVRLSFGLVALTLSVISVAQVLGIFPDTTQAVLDGRFSLCKAIGVHCAAAVQNGVDIDNLNAVTSSMVSQNQDVLSMGVRDAEGQLLVEAGGHEALWRAAPAEGSTPEYVRVPIFKDAQQWGTVEIGFRSMHGGVWGWLTHPAVGTMLFVGLGGFLVYILYLRRTLKILNPQAVIPDRIQAMLNTLTEGVVVIDKREQIILANEAFAAHVEMPSDKLPGKVLSSLSWASVDQEEGAVYPWKHATETGETMIGVPLKLTTVSRGVRTMMVNAAPIHGGDGGTRGALATFDDVTHVEKKNVELEQNKLQLENMLGMLKQSRDQITEQNEELKRLATRDPLTNCFNRRSLFDQFDSLWRIADQNKTGLGCVMFDIDKFKLINDTQGHAVGDQVLREIAEVLKEAADEMDVVARYGGEEFVVLIRNGTVAAAADRAEKIRVAIEARHCAGLNVTSSFGVSSKAMGADSPKDLLEQADKALYAAKHGGRNRVERWDQMPEETQETEVEAAAANDRFEPQAEPQDTLFLPFQAVTGLVAALTQRDAATGQHSKRVADLCVLMAKDLMSPRDCFMLEVAALVHDLGKLGLPDTVLRKTTPLSEDEKRMVRLHEEIGLAIVASTFGCPELTRIVETCRAWFDGSNPRRAELPSSTDIPRSARILAIADAFDGMVSGLPYQAGCGDKAAFANLRSGAGKRFDPELVDRFIEIVQPSRNDVAEPPVTAEVEVELEQAVEQLANAFGNQDAASIPFLAQQLKVAAARRGLDRVVQLAADLERVIVSGNDLDKLSQLTDELFQLCRSCQEGSGNQMDTQGSTQEADEANENPSGGPS